MAQSHTLQYLFFLISVIGIHFAASDTFVSGLTALGFLGLLVILISAKLQKKKTGLERTGYEPLFLLYVAVACIAALDAYVKTYAVGDILNIVASLVAFYVLSSAVRNKKEVDAAWLFVIGGLFLYQVIGALQIIDEHFVMLPWLPFVREMNMRVGSSRVASLFLRQSGANAYAAYLSLLVPIYLGWLINYFKTCNRKQLLVHILFVGLLVLNIVFTYSRALFVALGFSTMCVVFSYPHIRKVVLTGLTVFCIVVVLFVAPVQRTIFSLFDTQDTSNTDHANSFRMALMQIAEHPWNGWGGAHVKASLKLVEGQWQDVHNTYKNPYDKLKGDQYWNIHNQALKDGVIIVHSPHNTYFYFMLNYGICGLILLVTLFLFLYKKAGVVAEYRESGGIALARGIQYGLISFAVYSWFQDSLITAIVGQLFWLIVLLIYKLERYSVPAYRINNYRLTILAYHRVLPDVAGQTLAVSVRDFQWQIQVLKKKKHAFLTLREFYTRHVSGSEPIRQNIAILTFDDGYADNYLHALPILKAEQVPATFFITTGYIDQVQPYYWDLKNKTMFDAADLPMTAAQIKELKAQGMEIGSHTVHHYELTKLTKQDVLQEFADSKKTLEKLVGPVTAVCYPRGMADAQVVEAAEVAGYTVGVITKKPGLPRSVLALPRVGLYGHDTPWTFLLKITPLYLWLRGIR